MKRNETQYFDVVRNDPDVQLAKATFKRFLESHEKRSMLRRGFNIDIKPYAGILEFLLVENPSSLIKLRASGESPELNDQFLARLIELLRLDQDPIFIANGQQDFVSLEGLHLG